MQLGVDFKEGEKPSKHGRDQLRQLYSHESQVWNSAQMVPHPATDPVRPGLTWSLVVKGNALTAYATRVSHIYFSRGKQLGSVIWFLRYRNATVQDYRRRFADPYNKIICSMGRILDDNYKIIWHKLRTNVHCRV